MSLPQPTQTRYYTQLGFDHTTALIKAADHREEKRFTRMVLKDIKNHLDVNLTIAQKRTGSSVWHVMEDNESVFSGFLWKAEEYLQELIEDYNAIINPEPTHWDEVKLTVATEAAADEEYFV